MRVTGNCSCWCRDCGCFDLPRAAFALKKKKKLATAGVQGGRGEMSFKIGLSSNQEGQLVGRVEDTRVHDDDTM